jgi:hypothetical protein
LGPVSGSPDQKGAKPSMSRHSFLAWVLTIAAGVILGLLVSRRIISMRDVLNLLLGVVLGVLLAQYLLPRRIFGQIDQATDKCHLSVAPLAHRAGTGWRTDSVP